MKHPSLEPIPAPAASIPPVVTTVLRSSQRAEGIATRTRSVAAHGERGRAGRHEDARAFREERRAVRAGNPTRVPKVDTPPGTHAGHLHAYVDEYTRLVMRVEFHAQDVPCPDSEPAVGRPQRLHTDNAAAYRALVLWKGGAS